jgi:hypothetical protein
MPAATFNRSAVLTADTPLPQDAVQNILERGFLVIPGPAIPGGLDKLSDAYDHVVATGVKVWHRSLIQCK